MTSNIFATKNKITWCPGCGNFFVLESVKKALLDLTNKGYNKKSFSMVTGIGCHAKIFDYLDISGIYGIHGRVLPVMLGMKLANPKLNVLGFSGDGDAYSEGMSHFIHAFRYNPNMTLIVHNNQSFSLTTGQATATSQRGYKNKAEPFGEINEPLNPVQIALACGGTFIARCNPLDIKSTSEILKKAIQHKGFSFVEMMQKCLIFNKKMNSIDKFMVKIKDNHDFKKAIDLVREWDYNLPKKRIPIGILYHSNKKILKEKIYEIYKKN